MDFTTVYGECLSNTTSFLRVLGKSATVLRRRIMQWRNPITGYQEHLANTRSEFKQFPKESVNKTTQNVQQQHHSGIMVEVEGDCNLILT